MIVSNIIKDIKKLFKRKVRNKYFLPIHITIEKRRQPLYKDNGDGVMYYPLNLQWKIFSQYNVIKRCNAKWKIFLELLNDKCVFAANVATVHSRPRE